VTVCLVTSCSAARRLLLGLLVQLQLNCTAVAATILCARLPVDLLSGSVRREVGESCHTFFFFNALDGTLGHFFRTPAVAHLEDQLGWPGRQVCVTTGLLEPAA